MPQHNDGIGAKILQVLTRSPGEVVYVQDIASHAKVTEQQVKSALAPSRLAKYPIRIDVVVNGKAWRYMGDRSPQVPEPAETPTVAEKRIFEEIGTTKSGQLIIQDMDGNLFRAEEL